MSRLQSNGATVDTPEVVQDERERGLLVRTAMNQTLGGVESVSVAASQAIGGWFQLWKWGTARGGKEGMLSL